MIAADDLRSCDNCGNVFLKKTENKMTNRCPACNVWKKEVPSNKLGDMLSSQEIVVQIPPL